MKINKTLEMKRILLLFIVISLLPFVSSGDIITLATVNASEYCLGASCISSWDIGGGDVLGSGTANRLAYWTSSNTLDDFDAVVPGPFLRSGGSSLAYWGSIAAADVPNLAASKITSGEFNVARIPNLDASKITSGIFDVERGGTGHSSLPEGRILFGAETDPIGMSNNLKWQQNTLDVKGKIKSNELFLTSGESTISGFSGTSGYIAKWSGDDVDDSWCTDNGGIVLPFNRSLCWQRSVNIVTRNHAQAQDYCAGLDLGGGLEWHLPEDYELLGDGNTPQEGSLLWWMNDERGYDQGTTDSGRNYGTWLNTNWGFTGFADVVYWSNTYSDPPTNNSAWYVRLSDGHVAGTFVSSSYRVVCVSRNEELVELIISDSSIYEDGDGNIGIGTNEPQQKLHVNGNILADAYYHSSDEILKENIIPLEDVSNKLMQINPSRFNFINQNEEKIGLIAQDLEKTFPEFVNSKNEFKTIEYSSLVVPLIKAIQEQKDKIEKQQNEINELRQFIEKLIKNEN